MRGFVQTAAAFENFRLIDAAFSSKLHNSANVHTRP
jgi:hypothetical protein